MVGYPDQMTKLESNPSPARGRVFASLLKPFAMLAALLLLPVAVQAGWFTKVMGAAEQAAPRTAGLGAGTLGHAALHLRSLPAKTDGAALAAQATQEGHWRFVNRAGETFTAGTPEELKRVAA